MSYKQLFLLEKTAKYFEKENPYMLKEQSNHATLIAVESSDNASAKIAVLAYALSKICSKEHVLKNPVWPAAKNNILSTINECSGFLLKNKHAEFLKTLEKIEQRVVKVDSELGNYVRNVWDKAKIKIASSAYAQGLSLSQASELTEAEKSEVQNYVGITKIHDEEKTSRSMKQRMKIARAVFE